MNAALIKDVCVDLRNEYPGWLKSLEDPDSCANRFYSDVVGVPDLINMPEPESQLSRTKLMPMFWFLDCAIVINFHWAVFCIEKRVKNEHVAWKKVRFRDGKTNATFVLESVFLTLGRTLVGIRNLILGGLNHQACVLFRYYVELADLVLASMADESVFKDFIDSGRSYDGANKHWQKKLRPSRIREVVRKTENEFGFVDCQKKI